MYDIVQARPLGRKFRKESNTKEYKERGARLSSPDWQKPISPGSRAADGRWHRDSILMFHQYIIAPITPIDSQHIKLSYDMFRM